MKRIFIKSTFRNHNFIYLIDFFEQNLKNQFGDKVKIIHHRKLFNNKYSIQRFFYKISLFVQKLKPYDLVISDFYASSVYKTGKKRMYIFHGALTKYHPSLQGIMDKKRLNYHRALRRDTNYIVTLHENDKNFYLRHPLLEDLPLPVYLPYGLPRNDLLFNNKYVENSNREIREKFGLQNKQIVLYAPTFRDYDINPFLIIKEENVMFLNSWLENNNTVFIYRPHYFSGIIKSEYLKKASNIITVDSKLEGDTQKLLCACNALITDYSSIFIDFLILQRPILFFPFDLDYYLKNNGLTIDFSNRADVPGKQVFTWNELMEELPVLIGNTKLTINYSESITRYFSNFDGDSSKRIWKFILNEIVEV